RCCAFCDRRALIRPVASRASPAWLSPFYLFTLARDETLPHPNGIIALLRFSIWRWAFHRSLVLDYSHPVFREARMVGRNFLANHARRLDDRHQGADGHAGGRFDERGVTCCNLLPGTEETQLDCLDCSPGSRRGWGTIAIVSSRCGC